MDWWTILGILITSTGTVVTIIMALRAVNASEEAQKARNEIKKAVHQHQRAEGISDVVKKLDAAQILLKPFYQPGERGAEGGNHSATRTSLTGASIALSEAKLLFKSERNIKIAEHIIKKLDDFSNAYPKAKTEAEKDELLKDMFKTIRNAKSTSKQELNASRRAG